MLVDASHILGQDLTHPCVADNDMVHSGEPSVSDSFYFVDNQLVVCFSLAPSPHSDCSPI